MRFLFIVLSILATVFLTQCQTRPTKVYEAFETNISSLVKGARKPIVIDDRTVVLDSRKPFEYAMAHIEGSTNLTWQQFAQVRGPVPGLIKSDRSSLARRLARLGIGPKTKVVIVGEGTKGKGDDGRLAWTLFYLGVEDIQFASVEYFKVRFSNAQSPPRKNEKTWKPRLKESVVANKKDVMAAIAAKSRPNQPQTYILDVRSEKEYFHKQGFGMGYSTPDLQAMNIEWRKFFTALGRPNLKIKKDLHGVGIGPNSQIIVLSNNGVRSAAVTMALLSMGFRNAANLSGGLLELMSRRQNSF